MSREAHGGHVVIDHSPQADSEEWWTGGASHSLLQSSKVSNKLCPTASELSCTGF